MAIGVDGDVLRVDGADGIADPTTRECVTGSIRPLHFDHRSDATIIHVEVGHAVEAIPPTTAPPTAIAPSTSAAYAQAEQTARAIVDRLHDVLLSCSDRAPIAVTASWLADGTVTLSLVGTLAGSAVDGCVRAAGQGSRIDPTPGAAGSILHPVH